MQHTIHAAMSPSPETYATFKRKEIKASDDTQPACTLLNCVPLPFPATQPRCIKTHIDVRQKESVLLCLQELGLAKVHRTTSSLWRAVPTEWLLPVQPCPVARVLMKTSSWGDDLVVVPDPLNRGQQVLQRRGVCFVSCARLCAGVTRLRGGPRGQQKIWATARTVCVWCTCAGARYSNFIYHIMQRAVRVVSTMGEWRTASSRSKTMNHRKKLSAISCCRTIRKRPE